MTTTPSSDQAKQKIAADFNQVAAGYDTMRFVRLAAARLVELAALRLGERVLDIATGTGHVALAAAEQVAPTGHVVGIDLSEGMLEQARQKAAAAGQRNVEFRPGDAERLEFGDASFDVVLCASAIFFMQDQLAAAHEWRRVLRPGGRLLFSSFGGGDASISEIMRRQLPAHGASLPPVQSGEARRAEPDQCVALLRAGGFTEIAVTTEQLGYYFGNAEAWWEEINQTPWGVAIAPLPPEQLAALRQDLLAELATFMTDAGIWRDNLVNFATGYKP